MEIYVVKEGDTIVSIARQFGVLPSRLASDNGIEDPERLAVGQALVILRPRLTHTVRQGENLTRIAADYGVSLTAIWQNNPNLSGSERIYPGQTVVIAYEGEKVGTLSTNGYLYPFIDREVLRRTLPYLTYATVFSYGFDGEGNLIAADDEEILPIIRSYGVVPILLLSTIEDGKFSNQRSSNLFQNEAAQDKLIGDLLAVMEEKGYGGVDIDFEYVFAGESGAYADFVAKVRDALAPGGYSVMVSLAPKTSADQEGLLYQGHDYRALGEAADGVLLMTYEWGYTYSPPMAVAPLNKVGEVVGYAVTEIPTDKIYMGVPNYGYDWILPFEEGRAARSIGNVAAVSLAADEGAEIMFDETAQSPYFNYTDDGVRHQVWFEDARSVKEKFALADAFGLRGVGFWNIMRYFPQNWAVLNGLYEIRKE